MIRTRSKHHAYVLAGIVWFFLGGASQSRVHADEDLFGYVRGAEPNPKGALDAEQWITRREGKGTGYYEAYDTKTEFEYGITDRLTSEFAVLAMAIDTRGIIIDGYLPKDEKYGLRYSGIEGALKYNFLSAAKDPVGLTTYTAFYYTQLDPHSGQDKSKYSMELKLLLQKFFLDDQLVVAANIGMEATHAQRKPVANMASGVEWSTDPEMEIGLAGALGASYRFAPNWFVGAEALYEEEHETEVGLERWSLQAGPTLHYGGQKWWGTFAWLTQIKGGGEMYAGQSDTSLHLIEKTQQELRLKVGYNF